MACTGDCAARVVDFSAGVLRMLLLTVTMCSAIYEVTRLHLSGKVAWILRSTLRIPFYGLLRVVYKSKCSTYYKEVLAGGKL